MKNIVKAQFTLDYLLQEGCFPRRITPEGDDTIVLSFLKEGKILKIKINEKITFKGKEIKKEDIPQIITE